MNEEEEFLKRLAGKRISRRDLLEIAGKLGLSAAAIAPLLAACGGTATPAATATTAATGTASATATAAATGTASASATAAGAAPALTGERAKTFVQCVGREGSTIDPAVYWQAEMTTVMYAMYDPLIESVWHPEDGTFSVEPGLAESWEISPDNLSFTFHLKKGVTFQDGEPYNAAAQKFTFDRAIGINQGPAYMLTDVNAKTEVVDDYTLKLTLDKPVALYLQWLAGSWYPAKPVSPKAVKDHATASDQWAQDWFKGNGVGTGPYKLDEWVPNQQYTLSKYDGYWKGWNGNHMDKIIHRIIPEMSTARMLLQKGDLDAILEPLPPTDFQALVGQPGIVTLKTPSILLNVIQMHCQKAPTNDINVRKGLAAAFDYQAAINNIYGGLAVANPSDFLPGWEGHHDLPEPKKDLEAAKKFFQTANFSGSVDLIYIEGGEIFRRIAEMFQADLASIGVTLNVKPVSLATMFEQENASETAATMVMIPWGPDNTDSYSIANILWNSKFPPGGINWSLYKNPQVDDIITKATVEPDQAKRTQMWEQLDQIISNDVPWIVIADVVNGNAFRSDIKGSLPSMSREWSIKPYDIYRG